VLRPATVCGYSKRQRLDLVVNILTNLAYHTGTVKVMGGSQLRPNIHIDDMVRSYISVLTAKEHLVQGEIFNVGSGSTISVNTLVKLLGGDSVHIPKRPGEPDCTFADINKIKDTLGWSPKVKISDGVTSLLDDISYWANAPVWTPESIKAATEDWFKYLSDK
jgi:UDP-glucose 4-epimerase